MPSFLSCSTSSSCSSFVICFILVLGWCLICFLSLPYFPTSFNTSWNSMDEMSPCYIACEMILTMLCNLPWASSLTASCFSCFVVNILNYLCVITVAREKSRLFLPNAIPTERLTIRANATMEIPPVIAVDAVRSESITFTCDCVESFNLFSQTFTNLNLIKQICVNFS